MTALLRFEQSHSAYLQDHEHASRFAATSAASDFVPEVERHRAQLISAISRLAKEPAASSPLDNTSSVDSLTVDTATQLVGRLPADRAMPVVVPDGDGGLALLWDKAGQKALLTVDGVMLFLVRDPGRPTSYHFSPVRFDGETIPKLLLAALPSR